MYGRDVCISGTQELESIASHPAHVGYFDSICLKRIQFLVQFIKNSVISDSFWTFVFCRSLSSAIKLESSTICFFIPFNGSIF